MRLLLDTCTFLWLLSGDTALSSRVLELVRDPSNEVWLSAVSCWEISIKHRLGKLPLPASPESYVRDQRVAHRIDSLPLGEEASLYEAKLPLLHRDPFDRMLVCQSIVEGLAIATPDELISRYPIRTVW